MRRKIAFVLAGAMILAGAAGNYNGINRVEAGSTGSYGYSSEKYADGELSGEYDIADGTLGGGTGNSYGMASDNDGLSPIDENLVYDTDTGSQDDLLSDEMKDLIENADFYINPDDEDSYGDFMDGRENATPGDATPGDADGNEDGDDSLVPGDEESLENSYNYYDMRTTGNITSVKNQGGYNTCWAFGATGMAETSMLKQGFVSKNASGTTPDYSEFQLAYFTYHSSATKDPLGNLEGDYNMVGSSNRDFLENGGSPLVSQFTLASWVGLVDESLAPYSSARATAVLDPSLEYTRNAVHMKDSRLVENVNRDYVKDLILTYGAAITGIKFDTSYFARDGVSYVYPNQTMPGHAVLLIGWDDSYSRNNFSYTPEGDGAWLVKNSWGKGNHDYFWISYYDPTLLRKYNSLSGKRSMNTSSAFRFEPAGDYDFNYQYDGGYGNQTYNLTNGNSIANIFKISGDMAERLSAVSFALADDNVDYSIQLYRNPKAAYGGSELDPVSGTPVLARPVTGRTDYAGIYTVKLGSSPVFYEGETVSIVITLSDSDSGDSKTTIYLDGHYSDSSYNFYSHVEPNQSFLVENGITKDLYRTRFVTGTDASGNRTYVYGSDVGLCARIKAFTTIERTVKTSYATVYDGIDYSSVYDYNYYVSKYPDVWKALKANDAAVLRHFVLFGMKEGRRGNDAFDVYSYKNAYADLRNVYGDNLAAYYQHYARWGRKEGRNRIKNVTTRVGKVTMLDGVDYSAVFDADYYFGKNPDIVKAYGTNNDIAALRHFVNFGMAEGRKGNAPFNVISYAYRYPDIRHIYKNDLKRYYMHFQNFGKKEGRVGIGCTEMRGYYTSYSGTDYSLVYDYNHYVLRYPDIKKAYGLDDQRTLEHFVKFGMSEGRQAKTTFNLNVYKSKNADLVKVYGTNNANYYVHYIKFGYKEGRKAY
ncbi:MAG: hypothetical protein IJ619_03535 [Eubacterium sp.]|nr:hypothetical protein [Eubacterium sp.]